MYDSHLQGRQYEHIVYLYDSQLQGRQFEHKFICTILAQLTVVQDFSVRNRFSILLPASSSSRSRLQLGVCGNASHKMRMALLAWEIKMKMFTGKKHDSCPRLVHMIKLLIMAVKWKAGDLLTVNGDALLPVLAGPPQQPEFSLGLAKTN